MKKIYTLDTNSILRYLLGDNKSQYKQSKAFFDKARSGEISLILAQSVFTEVIFVLSSCYNVPRDKIAGFLVFLITYKGMECESELLKLALSYYKDKNIHIVDALLLARSRKEGIELLTFDKKLQKMSQAL
jgi:predicted nucleic-acid-binding protein